MTTLIRVLGGLPGAVIVTALIFLILAMLIGRDQDVQLTDETTININVLRQLEDRTLTQQTDVERPVLDQPPPPPPMVNDPSFRPDPGGARVAAPDLSADVDIGTGFNPDREAQPLVRIPPQYPSQCSGAAGQTETVVMEFNVTPEGTVVNPEVIQSTNRCFNRAATRAVQRWKYAPKIVNNEPQPRFGVRTALDFVLEGE